MTAPSSPYAEPKNGDYVAYLAQLERHQLRVLIKAEPAAPAPEAAQTQPQNAQDSSAAPAPHEQAAQVLRRLKQTRGTVPPATLVPGIIGVVLVMIGLAIESGWLFVVIGAYLIFVMVKALRKRVPASSDGTSPAKQISQVFDVHSWGAGKSETKRKKKSTTSGP